MKIDNSTYKAIKKDKKRKNRKPSRFEMSELGSYGRIRKKRNIKLVMVIFLLLLILADVLFSIIVFHTRKTWFIIIACVMSIPFARNLIDYFMAIKSKPLNKETYEKTKEMADRLDKRKRPGTFFGLDSRGHRSDRTPSPEEPSESPRHFAASMDESVIVGYYTLKKCLSKAPRPSQILSERSMTHGKK